MFPAFLRKIVAPELVEMIGEPRIKWVKPKQKLSSVDKRRRQTLKNRARARRNEARALALRSGNLFPPQQGNRRAEWSSARVNKWAALNGLPKEEPNVSL